FVSHGRTEIGVQAPPPALRYSKVTLAMPVPPTSVEVEVSVTVPLTCAPGSVMPAAGGTVSTVQASVAGLASVFPAASVARTSNVCAPWPRVGRVSGVTQEL